MHSSDCHSAEVAMFPRSKTEALPIPLRTFHTWSAAKFDRFALLPRDGTETFWNASVLTLHRQQNRRVRFRHLLECTGLNGMLVCPAEASLVQWETKPTEAMVRSLAARIVKRREIRMLGLMRRGSETAYGRAIGHSHHSATASTSRTSSFKVW